MTSKLLVYILRTFPPIFKKVLLRFCSLFSELDSSEKELGKKQIISLVEQFQDSPERQKILLEIHNTFIPGSADETHFQVAWSAARVMDLPELPLTAQRIVNGNTACPRSTLPSANARSTADAILVPGTLRADFITITI